jgi:hypothetical protein
VKIVHGFLISETSEWPGSHGDSCANTCRHAILDGHEVLASPFEFMAAGGYQRHPELKDTWGAWDFSNDQALPLLIRVLRIAKHNFILDDFKWKIPASKTWVSPGVWCLARGWIFLFGLVTLAQCFLFKIPWRWDDEKQRIARSEGHSADYLNMVVSLKFLRERGYWWIARLCWRVLDPWLVGGKVYDYFKPEPNCYWHRDLFLKEIRAWGEK